MLIQTLTILLLPSLLLSSQIEALNATCRDVCREKVEYGATICVKNCTANLYEEKVNFGVFLNCSTFINEKRKNYKPFDCGKQFCEQSYAFTNNTMILRYFEGCFEGEDSKIFELVLFTLLFLLFAALFLLYTMRIGFRCAFESDSGEIFQRSVIRALAVSYSFIFSFLIAQKACKAQYKTE